MCFVRALRSRVEMLHKNAWVSYLRRPQSPHGRSPGGALNKQPRAPAMHTYKLMRSLVCGRYGRYTRKGSLIWYLSWTINL